MRNEEDELAKEAARRWPAFNLPKTILHVYAWMRGPLSSKPGPLYERTADNTTLSMTTSDVFETFSSAADSTTKSTISSLRSRKSCSPASTVIRSPSCPPFLIDNLEADLRMLSKHPSDTINSWSESTESNHNPQSPDSNSAYGNYGYVKINGRWVDPDSEQMIAQAMNNTPWQVPLPRLPGVRADAAHAPQILLQDELNKEYDDFCDFVSDDEGDPRTMHIKPEVFARWAEGVRKRRRSHRRGVTQQIIEEQPVHSKKPSYKSKAVPAPLNLQRQFDIVTGEAISPSYDIDEFPEPLLASRGWFNFSQRPSNFQRSFPKDHQKLSRIFIGAADHNTEDEPPHPVDEDDGVLVETFENNPLLEALAQGGGREAGIEAFAAVSAKVHFLRAECDRLFTEMQGGFGVCDALTRQVEQLEREVALLRARRATLATPKTATPERHMDFLHAHVDDLEQSCAETTVMVHTLRDTSGKLRERAGGLLVQREELMGQMHVGSLGQAYMLHPNMEAESGVEY